VADRITRATIEPSSTDGVLMGFAENDPIARSMVAAFRSALAKLGWTEGGNVRIELR
jgi:hypothetical protein